MATETLTSGVRSTGKRYGISDLTIPKFFNLLKERKTAQSQFTMESVSHKRRRCTFSFLQKSMKKLLIKKMGEPDEIVNISIAAVVSIITANNHTMLKEKGNTIEL